MSEQVSVRIKRILFPTDFTLASSAALPYAAAMARRFGSTIYAVHVIQPESYAQVPPGERDMVLEGMSREAEEQVRALLAHSHFKGIPCEMVLERGEVLPVLSQLVERLDIDLIVTASHGKHGFHKLLTSSVAEEIARLAACPVLLIGPEVNVAPEGEVHLDRILFATDFSAESPQAMDYAYELARVYAAHLCFLHVIEAVWTEPLATRVPAEDFFRLRLAERGWPVSKEGIEPELLVRNGSRETVTLETAAERDVQLIVLSIPGTGHPDLAAHLPGPFAYNIVSHARCPVMIVRDHPK